MLTWKEKWILLEDKLEATAVKLRVHRPHRHAELLHPLELHLPLELHWSSWSYFCNIILHVGIGISEEEYIFNTKKYLYHNHTEITQS